MIISPFERDKHAALSRLPNLRTLLNHENIYAVKIINMAITECDFEVMSAR